MLGITFDTGLTMESEINKLAKCLSWKIKTLLRVKPFYTTAEAISEYKARVLSYVEYRTAALYHAATSALDRIDNIQVHFLREIGIRSVKQMHC